MLCALLAFAPLLHSATAVQPLTLRARAEIAPKGTFRAVIEVARSGGWQRAATGREQFASASVIDGELRLVGRMGSARWERRITASGMRARIEDRFSLPRRQKAVPPIVEWAVSGARPLLPGLRSGGRLRSLHSTATAPWGSLILLGSAAHFERSSPTPPALGWRNGALAIGFEHRNGATLPREFSLQYELIAIARDLAGDSGTHQAWLASGARRMDRALPQTMPFSEYARTSIPAGLDEPTPGSPSKKAYFEVETEGVKVAAASGGKPVRVSVDANPVRTAFAMRWWAEFFKSQRMVWAPKADLMASLAMVAMERAGPINGVEHPTFDPLTFKWYGSPTDDDRVATWIWLLKYSRRFDWRHDKVLDGATRVLGEGPFNSPMRAWLCVELARLGVVQDAERRLRGGLRSLGQPHPWDAQGLVEATLYLLSLDDQIMRRFDVAHAASWLSNYQFDWSPPGLGAVAPFGSFAERPGSQGANSAFSGSFGVTLMRAGKALGRLDLFERGVAAIRASVAPLCFPLAIDNMVFPNPLQPTGFGVPGSNEDGRDRPSSRISFDATEGPMFAAIAEALDEFGGIFEHIENWSVGIDGVRAGSGGTIEQLLRMNPVPWTGVRAVDRVRSDGSREHGVSPMQPFEIRRIEGRWEDGRTMAVAIPAMGLFGVSARAIFSTFEPSTGRSRSGHITLEGVAAAVTPREASGGPIRVRLEIDGRRVPSASAKVWFDANLEVGPGWHAQGDFAQPYGDWLTPAGGRRISTRGNAGREGAAIGTIYSPRFMGTGHPLRFRLRGPSTVNLGVTLEDARTGAIFRTARPTGIARVVRWPTIDLRGHMLRIRFVDREARLPGGYLDADIIP